MPQTKESRFGWGSLLAAFLGGAFFSQVAFDEHRDNSSVGSSESLSPSETEIQSLVAPPSSAAEASTAAFEAENQSDAVEPQPFIAAPVEPTLDVYYQNCSAARAAGAAPVYADEPGYSRRLDRDGDGVGCE